MELHISDEKNKRTSFRGCSRAFKDKEKLVV
jgi:hypothetical protein